MANLIKQTAKIAVVIIGILLTACAKDLSEPDDNGGNGNGESISGIPDEFNFSTTVSRQLTVNVVDQYDGQYFYTMEVYDADPILNPSATLLAGGKTNSKVPFHMNFPTEKTLETFYLVQTDPFGRKNLYMYDVTDGEMVCNLGESVITKSEVTKAADVDKDRIDFSYEEDKLITITGSKDVTLETNKKYLITKEFTGILKNLDGANNVAIYVKGEWKINQEILTFQNHFNLYVLKDGKVSSKKKSRMQCNNNTLIAVQYDGEIDGNIDIQMNNGGVKLVNEGEIDVDNIIMESSATIINYCCIEADEQINAQSGGASIIMKPYTMIECGSLKAGNLTIDMDVASIFKVEKDDEHEAATGVANFNSWNNKVNGPKIKNGTLKDFALFEAGEITNGVTFSENVKCYAKDKYSQEIKVNAPAAIAIGFPDVEIDDDECNRNSGNHNPETGSGDKEDEYKPTTENLPTFTYLFEDNWPAFGDYDMNDLVMDITISNTMIKGNAVSVTFNTKVKAVGATKPLYAFARIEAEGMSKMVVPLFDGEAHALMNVDKDVKVNTYSYTCEPVEVNKTYELPAGVKGMVTADNLNVFIVWGEPTGNTRNEVHSPDFSATENAAKHPASVGYKYKYLKDVKDSKPEYNNMMWALRIPAKEFVSYPKESVSIMKAYDKFENWAKSGGKEDADWYKHPAGKEYIYSKEAK